MSKEAMKQALEALRKARRKILTTEECHAAITFLNKALEEALAKQEVDSADSAAWRLGYDAGVARQEAIYESAKQEQELDPVHEYRKGFIAGQIDMRDRPEEQSAQHVGEPVAWVCNGVNNTHDIDFDENDVNALPVGTMLYTTSQPVGFAIMERPWVGLTDEDKAQCIQATAKRSSADELIAAIEAKLKEKNG